VLVCKTAELQEQAGQVQTPADKTITDPSLRFLAGEGEMRRRIREFEWSKTELGDPTGWSNGLKIALTMMLNCGAPAYLAWGPRFIQFYNDAYIALLGQKKHPLALGITTAETWNEIWDFVGPAFNGIMASGCPLAETDKRLPMQRNGYLEECYFTFSYSPLLDDDYRVNGVLVQAWETTSEFVSNRRANVVRMLVQGLSEATDMSGIRTAFEQTVRENRQDLPFGLWYEIRASRSGLDLVTAAGIERGSALSPECVDLQHGSYYSGLMNVDTPVLHSCLLPPGLLRLEPAEALLADPQYMMVKPLCYSTYQHPNGYVVLAVNPMRPNDAAQRDFLQLIRMHLENAMRRVNAAELERRELEHQFESIMAVLPCLVWMCDADGSCTFVNQTWIEFTGIAPAQAMGTGWAAALHSDDLDNILRLHTSRGRTTLTMEYRLRDANGEYRWVLDKATPRYGIHGEFLGYTGTCIDITDRKQAEQRIIASQTELRSLYERLQQVRAEERCALAREVHDQLGQILSAAKIDIKLLEEGVRSGDTPLSRDNIVTELRSASSTLESAIQVVRRLATELRPPELESQGLSAAIQWHALDFERRTRIRCKVALESDMPQLNDASEVALLRIFQESMTNILRHAEATEVCISLGCRGDRVLLRVRDNGVGISRQSARSGRAMGLKGMRERAAIAGGRLVVGPLSPGGTLVAASLPLVEGNSGAGYAMPSFFDEENT
jgi:PAS domain S-box-containing protein